MKRATFLVAVGVTWAAGAFAQTASPEVSRTLPGLQTHPLTALPDTNLRGVLGALESEKGLISRDRTFYTLPGAPLFAVPLFDSESQADLVLLYYSPETRQHFVLRLMASSGGQEARLRSAAGAELVFTAEGVRFESAGTGVVDELTCIARSINVELDPSSLEQLLLSATCKATTLNALVLTAFNCLSFPHPVATVGCINGIARLISCGLLECQPPGDCFARIDFGTEVRESWTSSCPSAHRGGRHARYYTFSLTATTRVEINLSSSADPYLYLLEGEGSSGRIITRDDDDGPGNDSRIRRTLAAGTYTIEATTDRSGATGGFVLSLQR